MQVAQDQMRSVDGENVKREIQFKIRYKLYRNVKISLNLKPIDRRITYVCTYDMRSRFLYAE